MSSMIQGVTAADFKSLGKPCRRIFLVLRERPWARSYMLRVYTPGDPPQELVAISRARLIGNAQVGLRCATDLERPQTSCA